MSNIMDYLKWRGDIPFDLLPLNEVDNLILSTLAYVNLDNIVPAPGEGEITIFDAVSRYKELFPEQDGKSFLDSAPKLLKKCAETERFHQIRLRNYINRYNVDANLQFCAVEMVLPDNYSYISFRGTDDTIVGWKEDFYLSLGEVRAQKEAADYLENVLRMNPDDGRKVYVGGHSKGGNLAEYAAASVPEQYQDRILTVFNNDGPGFDVGFLQSEAYKRIASRIHFVVPSFGVIGELLHHGIPHVIVKSTKKTITAHDPFTWQIMGTGYETSTVLYKTAQYFNKALAGWLEGLDPDKKKAFIDDFFAVLEAPGVLNISELMSGGLPVLSKMAQRLLKLDPDSRGMISQLILIILDNMGEMTKKTFIELIKKGNAELKNSASTDWIRKNPLKKGKKQKTDLPVDNMESPA